MCFTLVRRLLLTLGCVPAAVFASCDGPIHVDINSERIEIARPPPGYTYVGWIEMTGAEWEVLDDGVPAPIWPERHGRSPLTVQHSEGSDVVALPIRWIAGPQARRPSVSLRCATHPSPTFESFSGLAALVRAHGELTQGGDSLDGVRLVGTLAAAAWQSVGDPETGLWVEQQALQIAMFGAQRDLASRWAERILQRAESMERPLLANLARLVAGQMLLLLDEARALAHLRVSQDHFESIGHEYYANVARQEQCLSLRLSGHPSEAVDCYAEAISTHLRLGEMNSALRTQLNRATALSSLGRYESAFTQLVEAEKVAAVSTSPTLRAALSRQRAQFHTWGGQFDAALVLLRELRSHYEENLDLMRSAHTDFLIGTNFLLAGEASRSTEYFAEAEQRIAGTEHAHLRVRIRLAKGVALSALGRSDEAVKVAHAAVADLEQAKDLLLEQDAWMQLAEVLIESGKSREAAEALSRVPERATPRVRLRRALVAAEIGLYEPQGVSWQSQLESALEEDQLLLAMRIGERWIHELAEVGDQTAAFEQATRLYSRIIPVIRSLRSPALRDALSGQLHGVASKLLEFQAAGRLNQDLAEQVRWLLWQLAEASISLHVSQDESLLLALEKQIAHELLPGSGRAEVSSSSLHLELLGAAKSSLRADSTNFAQAPELVLRPAERLALPLVGKRAGGWLVYDGKVWSWWPIEVDRLRRVRGELLKALAGGHSDVDQLQPLTAELKLALGLERWLTPSVSAIWLGMHREIASVPLELAIPDGIDASVGWILSPSNAARQRLARARVLGVATFESQSLPDLSSVSREITSVAKTWSDQFEVQINSSVSRPELLEALASENSLVHLAAHGRASLSHYEGSGLWLSGTDRPEFVSAYRLRTAPISAELIVLSACETGQGAGRAGVGVGSVASNLVEGGAGTVIGTRWAVGDRAASAFSSGFHQSLRGDPHDVERALKQALVGVRRIPALRNPTHWAGWFALSRGIP